MVALAKHPVYLHALQDLRLARALLARPSKHGEVKWDEKKAIREVDAAMKEIRDAAIDDGKDIGDHEPVDVDTEWGGRMSKAPGSALTSFARHVARRSSSSSTGPRHAAGSSRARGRI